MYMYYCRSEEANKSFSAAVQLHDGLVKAWALWGDFLDQLFIEDKWVNDLWLYMYMYNCMSLCMYCEYRLRLL